MLCKCPGILSVPKVLPLTLIHKDVCPIYITPVLYMPTYIHLCLDIGHRQRPGPQQHGSMKGTSSVHALVKLVHKSKSGLDSPGTMIRIPFIDFSKDFDRVDHHTILTKCTSLGLLNVLIKWLTHFLCQNKQRVKVGSVKSEFTPVNAGVPQETTFGPISVIHHINDVKYVDNCTLWEECSSSGLDSGRQPTKWHSTMLQHSTSRHPAAKDQRLTSKLIHPSTKRHR